MTICEKIYQLIDLLIFSANKLNIWRAIQMFYIWSFGVWPPIKLIQLNEEKIVFKLFLLFTLSIWERSNSWLRFIDVISLTLKTRRIQIEYSENSWIEKPPEKFDLIEIGVILIPMVFPLDLLDKHTKNQNEDNNNQKKEREQINQNEKWNVRLNGGRKKQAVQVVW